MEVEKKVEIPHVKRKDFVSGVCDSIVISKTQRSVTVLFSYDTNDVLSESFIGSDNIYRPADEPIKLIPIREDVANISMSLQSARQLLEGLKNVLEEKK